jgi:hypothetical protein
MHSAQQHVHWQRRFVELYYSVPHTAAVAALNCCCALLTCVLHAAVSRSPTRTSRKHCCPRSHSYTTFPSKSQLQRMLCIQCYCMLSCCSCARLSTRSSSEHLVTCTQERCHTVVLAVLQQCSRSTTIASLILSRAAAATATQCCHRICRQRSVYTAYIRVL